MNATTAELVSIVMHRRQCKGCDSCRVFDDKACREWVAKVGAEEDAALERSGYTLLNPSVREPRPDVCRENGRHNFGWDNKSPRCNTCGEAR